MVILDMVCLRLICHILEFVFIINYDETQAKMFRKYNLYNSLNYAFWRYSTCLMCRTFQTPLVYLNHLLYPIYFRNHLVNYPLHIPNQFTESITTFIYLIHLPNPCTHLLQHLPDLFTQPFTKYTIDGFTELVCPAHIY